MTTLNQQAAEWALGLSWTAIPPEVVEDAKCRILDIVGVMLAGRDTELVAAVRRSVSAGVQSPEAATIGFPGKTSISSAALVNGVTSSMLELDDSHIETGVHSTGPVAALAIPLAQALKLPGRHLLQSFLIGSELTCRLAQIAPGMFHRNGFHPTAVFGIFGAIHTAARLLALDLPTTVNAVGIGGSMAAGSMASWEDGTSAKSLHVGLAASAAVQAIGFARQGISGPGLLFEGRFGFFRSHVQAEDYEFRYAALTEGLGKKWEVLNVASKAYPTGYVIQPFIEALRALNAQRRFSPEDIEHITCRIADYAIPLVCEPQAEKLRPKNTWHARVSLQHSVAEAIVSGTLDKYAYAPKRLADPTIRGLANRVRYVVDPEAADRSKSCGEVLISLRDGTVLRHRVDAMRGTRANPMVREDFIAKFHANTHDVLTPSLARQTADLILDLDRAADVSGVFDPLSS